jgi:hypothetical protein
MRMGRIALWTIVLFLPAYALHAQISPGELSSAHEATEGVDKCTNCHVFGKSAIPGDRCLSCHTELRKRIAAGTGYHARLSSRPCTECHKEHLGRSFAVVRLDTASFDHRLTGYPLEGKHRTASCRTCHALTRITADDVKRNRSLMDHGTFLGLARTCTTCHKDIHQGTIKQTCESCHNTAAWKPAPGFSHERARFPLTGKHQTVSCEKCHRPSQPGIAPVVFSGMDFGSCSPCHSDPHRGRFPQRCDQCHGTTGWKEGAARQFDHSTTRFPLRGKHAQVACEGCHKQPPARSGQSTVSVRIEKFSRCADCHADPHNGGFARRPDGGRCESCHNEISWKDGPMRAFDHGKTHFPLRGKHADLSCARCHVWSKSVAPGSRTPMDLSRFEHCTDCHAESHNGQFVSRPDRGACESCHTPSGFRPSTLSVADHATTRFPLRDGHTAVPCQKCHPVPEAEKMQQRIFRRSQQQPCSGCHADEHRGAFTTNAAPSCNDCHDPRTWQQLHFEHARARFLLDGRHTAVACAACHRIRSGGGINKEWEFRGRPILCEGCHSGRTR